MLRVSRVGAIGDIHAEDVRLAACLEFFATQDLDCVVAVGDLVDGPGNELRCCELLESHGVEAVTGNHDRWFLDEAGKDPVVSAFVRDLPQIREYETAHGALMLCHGLGKNDMNRLSEDDFGYALQSNTELQELLRSQSHRYVINGHSHRRMVKNFGGLTVVNVGTLFREHDPCCAVVDFDAEQVMFFDLQDPAALKLASTVVLS